MEKMTTEQKRVIELLDALDESRLSCDGGYPYERDGWTIPGYLCTATTDHDFAPRLEIYKWSDLLDRLHRAYQLLESKGCSKEESEEFLWEAWDEAEL